MILSSWLAMSIVVEVLISLHLQANVRLCSRAYKEAIDYLITDMKETGVEVPLVQVGNK